MDFSGKAAIVGIGATEFSKNSGRSEIQLAEECVLDALNDAGINPHDVDGMSNFVSDMNLELDVFNCIGGKELKFFPGFNTVVERPVQLFSRLRSL